MDKHELTDRIRNASTLEARIDLSNDIIEFIRELESQVSTQSARANESEAAQGLRDQLSETRTLTKMAHTAPVPQAAQAAQGVADDVVLPRSRLIRIDTVSNTVRVENVSAAGKETLSPLMPFDGTVSGLLAVLAAKGEQK